MGYVGNISIHREGRREAAIDRANGERNYNLYPMGIRMMLRKPVDVYIRSAYLP